VTEELLSERSQGVRLSTARIVGGYRRVDAGRSYNVRRPEQETIRIFSMRLAVAVTVSWFAVMYLAVSSHEMSMWTCLIAGFAIH